MLIRLARHTLHVLGAVVAVVTVAAALLAWRLTAGPVSLAFLSPTIERALARAESPYRIAFNDTILAVGGEDLIALELTALRAVDAEGRVFFSAPEVSFEVSLTRLLAGSLSIVGLEASRPVVRVVRGASGALAVGPGDSAEAETAPFDRLMADITGPASAERPLGALERFAIRGGTILVEDQASRRAWRASGVEAEIVRDATGIRGEVAFVAPFGRPSAHVDGTFALAFADRSIRVNARFTDIDPARVGGDIAALSGLAALRTNLTGTLAAGFGGDGAFRGGEAELWMGPGTLDVPGLYLEPLAIAGASARVRLDADRERLDVEGAEIDLGDAVVLGEGRVVDLSGDPWITLRLTAGSMPVEAVIRYWPEGLGVGARDWIARSLAGGTVANASAIFSAYARDIGVSDEPLHDLAIEADIAGTTFAYLPPMAPIVGTSGHLSIADFVVRLTGLSGTLGGLSVADAAATLPALDGSQGMTAILPVSGPLAEALALAADPTLDLPDRELMAATEASGTMDGVLSLALPRFGGLARSEVEFSVEGSVADLALPDLVPGYPLAGGAFDVAIDRRGMRAEGTVATHGVPLSVRWVRDFTADAAVPSEATVAATLDEASRAALSLPTGDRVTGPVPVALAIRGLPGGGVVFDLRADLTQAGASVPEIGWAKEPGSPGSLAANWRAADGGATEVTGFALAAPDLEVKGTARLAPEGDRIAVARAVQGRNDLGGEVAIAPDGRVALRIDGGVADLSPYVDRLTKEEEEEEDGGEASFTLEARLDQLYLRPESAFSDVVLSLDYAGDHVASLEARATMPEGAALTASIAPGAGGRTFRLDASNAGQALRLIDVIDTARGGTLAVEAVIDDTDPGRPAKGAVTIENIRVRDAPVLAQVLSIASLTGPLDMLSGDGIPFAKGRIPFVKRGSRIEIANARLAGAAIGLTAEGTIDIEADTIDVTGTVVPAYTINSLIGEVPILGDLLVGEKGGGLFAATYAVKGPIDDPAAAVNPLATLAPGFLRDLLFLDPDPTAETPAPPSGGENR